MQGAGAGSNSMSRAVAKQGQKLAEQGMKAGDTLAQMKPASVTAYGSGNAAQVYFDLFPRKITLRELNSAYPNMVDALVQHEGIGMVVGYADDMTPVALGKGGQRNLCTGEVIGIDPVAPYAKADGHGAGTIETGSWQLNRVMEFPHAGDLWLISTVYPDGTVAALEELIGNHGGLGGEQTDAFIFHPHDMEVMETRNSTDVFHILNNHRGKPVAEKPLVPAEAKVAEWAPKNLLKGLSQVGVWVGLALRGMVLDRDAYEAVVKNPYMTGPALLIGLAAIVLTALVRGHGFNGALVVSSIGLLAAGRNPGLCSGLAADQTGNFHQDDACDGVWPCGLPAFRVCANSDGRPGRELRHPGVGFPVRLDRRGHGTQDERLAHHGAAPGRVPGIRGWYGGHSRAVGRRAVHVTGSVYRNGFTAIGAGHSWHPPLP